ncbi:unnamed protein product [Mytilus edulis]|uniref:Mutator-like transposase domain-containing protein n=1 Tax=Mytilus edulis TaxID=6550 RepID=A0A8S3QKD5_MYTED|nr:unnamed protein product [Mytilus edulis]
MIESAEELKIIKRDSSEWDGEGLCKCAVSVDGSWSHVGYCARNGFVSVISVDTGKVLDYVTLSNECKGCKQWERERKTNTREFLSWFVEHDKVCTLNHEGSAKPWKLRVLSCYSEGHKILMDYSIQHLLEMGTAQPMAVLLTVTLMVQPLLYRKRIVLVTYKDAWENI